MNRVAIRLDRLAVNALEMSIRRKLEPRCANLPLYDLGLGEVVEQFVAERIPSTPVTMVDVAISLGILKKPGVRRVRA